MRHFWQNGTVDTLDFPDTFSDTLDFDADDNIFYKNHPTWVNNMSRQKQLTVILRVNNTDKQLRKKSGSYHAGTLVL